MAELTQDELDELELMEMEAEMADYQVSTPTKKAPPVTVKEPEPEPAAVERPDPYLYNDNGTVAGPNPAAYPTKDEARSYVTGLGNTLLNAQAMGGGDELAGNARAGIDFLSGNLYGDGEQSFTEARDMYIDDARGSRQGFAEENPGQAFGAELVGGLANPLNKVAPGLGAGRGWGNAGLTLARAAAEGSLAGLLEGEGSIEDRASNAGEGAAWGAGTAGGLRTLTGGAGYLSRMFGNDNIEEIIQADGTVKPLNLADQEGWLGRQYRNLLGRTTWGSNRLKNQEKPWIDAAADSLEESRLDLSSRKLDLGTQTARAKTQINDVTNANIDRQKVSPQVQPVPEVPSVTPKTPIDVPPAAILPDNVTPEYIIERGRQAIPEQSQAQYLAGVGPQQSTADTLFEMNRRIENYWRGPDAFSEVKNTDGWNLGDVRESLRNVADTPEARGQLGDDLRSILPKTMRIAGKNIDTSGMTGAEVLDTVFSGEIDGKVLIELRNSFARGANSSSGMSSAQQRQIANKFDDMIRGRLSGKELDQFNDQLNRYTEALSFQDTMRGNKASATGNVSIEDYNAAAGRYDTSGTSATNRPGLEATREAIAKRTALEETNQAALDQEKRGLRLAKQQAEQSANERSRIAAAKAQASAARDANKAAKNEAKEINQQVTGLNKSVAQQKRDRLADATRRRRAALAEESRTGEYGQAIDEAKRLRELATPQNATGLSEQLTNRFAGDWVPQKAGFVGNLLGAILTSIGGTNPKVQRFLAGQGPGQKALADALESGNIDLATRILSREAARDATEVRR